MIDAQSPLLDKQKNKQRGVGTLVSTLEPKWRINCAFLISKDRRCVNKQTLTIFQTSIDIRLHDG